MKIQLTVIGCGVFGRAIIDGLSSEANMYQSYPVSLTRRRKEAVEKLQTEPAWHFELQVPLLHRGELGSQAIYLCESLS